MKLKALAFLIVISCFLPTSFASANQGGYTIFGGVGLLFTPGSLRLGVNNWEVGYINVSFFGANYVVRSDTTYTTFGLGFTGSSVGFYGGVGWEPVLLGNLHFRAEAGAAGGISGTAVGGLLMGLSYWF